MYKCKIDVPVLCIFFARPKEFEITFEAVRQARPSTLLLWQDGPRKNRNDDIENINKCRAIAENIDWECTVHQNYHGENMGCDPSTFYAHKWAFSLVDKCIILEDDVVASQDFFKFCEELLELYKNDTRINKICGKNQVRDFHCSNSYFFSNSGSVWGWATWKRVADTWEEDYHFLENSETMATLRKLQHRKGDLRYDNYLRTCMRHKSSALPHWETVQSFARILNSQLCIIPKVNLTHNIGLGGNSTHSNLKLAWLPKSIKEAFYGDTETMSFPLKHPDYVFENVEYSERLSKIVGIGTLWNRLVVYLHKILRRLYYKFLKR